MCCAQLCQIVPYCCTLHYAIPHACTNTEHFVAELGLLVLMTLHVVVYINHINGFADAADHRNWYLVPGIGPRTWGLGLGACCLAIGWYRQNENSALSVRGYDYRMFERDTYQTHEKLSARTWSLDLGPSV